MNKRINIALMILKLSAILLREQNKQRRVNVFVQNLIQEINVKIVLRAVNQDLYLKLMVLNPIQFVVLQKKTLNVLDLVHLKMENVNVISCMLGPTVKNVQIQILPIQIVQETKKMI